jgi:hypothetical protein
MIILHNTTRDNIIHKYYMHYITIQYYPLYVQLKVTIVRLTQNMQPNTVITKHFGDMKDH